MTSDQPLFESSQKKPESAFLNLLFNVAIPIFLLNKGGKYVDPQLALVLAFAFPLGYGLRDYSVRRHINAFSVLGLMNVLVTGGLALAKLDGAWFAVKEAAMPTLIGFFVLGSAWSQKPFVKTLFFQPQLFRLETIEQQLRERAAIPSFARLVRTTTILLAGSFFLSAVLNYVLAIRIFAPLAANLEEAERAQAINEQIAQMTSSSMAIILVPSMICLFLIFWFLLKQLSKLTGVPHTELMKS